MTKEDVLTKELETYKTQGANLLMPSTYIGELSEFHKPVIEKVLLNPDPEQGDVYAHDNADPGPKKKWRPTKQALMKLSVCAGVIWSPTESRRMDNQSERNYIAYKAVGGIRKADGQPVFFSAEYDLDFEIIEEELRESYEAKTKQDWAKKKTAQEKAEYVAYCVKRDLLQKRKNKLKLCEAGAMNRVLRMLLGIKQAYTTAELQKPFVTARIVFRPDFSDKEVRSKLIDAGIKAMTGIYGESVAPQSAAKVEAIDVTPKEDEKEAEQEEKNEMDSLLVDFQNADADCQQKVIVDLSTKKNYALADFLKRCKVKMAKDIPAEKRLELFKHLLTLADFIPVDDDVPF